MEGISGKGALAATAGFFHDPDEPTVALPFAGRIKPPDEHRAAVEKALAGEHVHDGIRAYLKQKPLAAYDRYLAFDKHLGDYNAVMRTLAKVEKHGLPEDVLGIKQLLLKCRAYRPCQMRCCPICRMEHILKRLDDVVRVQTAHPDREVVRFVTFLDVFTYADDVQEQLEPSRRKLENRLDHGRRTNPDVYRQLSMILHGELDQVQRYRDMLTVPNVRFDDLLPYFETDPNLMPRKRETLLRLGYEPGRRDTGVLVTFHGLVFCPSAEHYEVFEHNLKTGNEISHKAVYPHPHQILFKSLYQNVSGPNNIKRIVSYMLKAKPYYANYVSRSEDIDQDNLADDLHVPLYTRRLVRRDALNYINMCRNITFRSLTIEAGVRSL